MSYPRFAAFVAPARPFPALWRLFLGVVTVFLVTFIWMAALFVIFTWMSGLQLRDSAMSLMMPLSPSPAGTTLFLLMIGGFGLGSIIAARFWQKRKAGSLFGPRVATLRNFAVAAGTSLAVILLLGAATLPFIETPTPNLDPMRWLLWLPLALFALAIQTGSEEVFFRGYLQSQLAARFRMPVIWLFLPSLIFALFHMQPGLTLAHTLTILVVTCLFGTLAGDLTARTGNIGAAWGFHFTNNAMIILIVSNEPALQGLSLYKTDNLLSEITGFSPLIAFELVTLIAIWALIRRMLAV